MSDRNRAIDALIAERLMGVTNDAVGIEAWKVWRRESCTGEWIPNGFCTDPAASDQLLDKMEEMEWTYCISFISSEKEYSCMFVQAKSKTVVDVTGETRKAAIALAVLAALGIEAPK